MSDSTYEFFARHPVFTGEEFAARPGSGHSQKRRAQESLLAHYVRSGRLLRLRRGLYAAVPFGVESSAYRPNPYLIAGKMADDAVAAYHTALELHGKAHSVHEEFVFLSHRTVRKARIYGGEFHGVPFQKALLDGRKEMYGVVEMERLGLDIRVTTLERTMVDVLDRPELGGGWEEIWRSLESIEYLDLEQVVRYTLMLKNGTTAAKVGFFLDQHRGALMVEDKHLRRLKRHLPEQACYMERGKRTAAKLVAPWRLFVPPEVLHRTWEEIA